MFTTPKTLLATALIAVLAAPLALAQGGQPPREARFETIDTDGDGRITEAEMAAFHAARFAAADTDGNGELSAGELTAAAEARRARGVERMIDRADADGSGGLSAAELAPRADAFARLDTDADGAISPEELARAQQDRRGGRDGRGSRGD